MAWSSCSLRPPWMRRRGRSRRRWIMWRRGLPRIGTLAEYLDCKTFPPVFIVHRRDLKGGELSNGELKPTQGVLVRANLTDAAFDET